MQANLAARVSVASIAAIAGVPERTLRRHFKRLTGKSPLTFHRDLRLEAAHRTLSAVGKDAEVTIVAADHGFSHFGQFAARYRQRFHELPSETRRSSRARPAQLPVTMHRGTVSLAVPTFVSVDDGAAQVALASTLTDRVISELGRMRWLEIVEADMPAMEQARYVLRGRVNAYGSRLQVTVRLLEASNGRHIWGTAFDGSLVDVPTLWRQAIEGIAGAVPGWLRAAEATLIDRKSARERTANDLATRAFGYASLLTAVANCRALEDLNKALSMDPGHPLAVALMSWCHAQRAIYNFGGSIRAEREEAQRLAAVALALDGEDPQVLAILGTASTMVGDLDLADVLIGKCLAIDPHCAMAWQRRGWISTYRGANTALADFRRALRLSGSHNFEKHNVLFGISSAHFLAGRYDRAADWALRGIQERPSAAWAYRIAAPAQARCGRTAEARRSAAVLLRHYPDLTVSTVTDSLPMQPDFLARHAEGLEAAGVPVY